MGKEKIVYRSYEGLHRFLSGMTVLCVAIVLMGSLLTGTSAQWSVVYAGLVYFGLLLATKIVVRLWATWEQVHTGSGKS
jgi:hypothetical protein